MDASHVMRERPVKGIPRIAGFTLLEVLVSLAILSATLILAYQGWAYHLFRGKVDEAYLAAVRRWIGRR